MSGVGREKAPATGGEEAEAEELSGSVGGKVMGLEAEQPMNSNQKTPRENQTKQEQVVLVVLVKILQTSCSVDFGNCDENGERERKWWVRKERRGEE